MAIRLYNRFAYYLCNCLIAIEMKKVLLYIFAMYFNVGLVFAQDEVADSLAVVETEYFKLMGKADEAIENGLWDDAEGYLLQALRLEPANPSNYLLMSNLGMVRFNMGHDSLALATLNDAHIMAPASVTVLNNRARIYSILGYADEAYNDYSMILQLDSMMIEPRFYHGIMALQKKDFITAKEDFDKLEQLVPESRYVSIGLASFYSASGEHIKAIKYYTKLIEEEPVLEYYTARAACYLMTQQYSEASSDISEGLKLSPEDADLYLYRAYLNKQLYRIEEAESDVKRAIELGADKDRVRLFFDIK